jgi:predicted porin
MRKNLMAVLLMGAFLTTSPVMAASPMTFYGIAHVSIDNISGTTKDFQVKSRSSRLGVKGEKTFKGDLQGFYKFEFQIDMADNSGGTNTDIFIKSRNMYVGLKDKALGSILIGRHDTAMKKAIGIKIFSDTAAEMTSVMGKDVGLYNRADNSIYYASPKLGNVQVLASVTTLEDATDKSFDLKSIAAIYKTKKLYIALANETADAGQEGTRLTVGYTFSSGSKVGLGYETGKYDTGADHEAYVVNGILKLSNLFI